MEVAKAVSLEGVDIASAKCPISIETARNENIVKVVTDNHNNALYFSRSLIPFPRGKSLRYWQHIGIYAYSSEALVKMSLMASSSFGSGRVSWTVKGSFKRHGHYVSGNRRRGDWG